MNGDQRNTIKGLTREALQYKSAGMVARVEEVNEQLRRLGADTIPVDAAKVPRQTRQSVQAETRRKRSAG
jgi:2-iminoacetate synthase ThiH